MNQMIWSLGNPNFCFPSNIWSKLAKGITLKKGCDKNNISRALLG
jgi:hypothetical protein